MLIARVNKAAVRQWYRADPAEPGQPPTAFRYPPAGSANAAVSLWIADLSGPAGAPLTAVDWDTAASSTWPPRAGRVRALRRRPAPRPAARPGARHRGRHRRDRCSPSSGTTHGSSSCRAARADALRCPADSRRHRRHPAAGSRRRAGHPARPPARQGARGGRRDRAVHRVRRADPDARVGLPPRGRAAPGKRGTGGARGHDARRHRRAGLADAGPSRSPDHDPAARRGRSATDPAAAAPPGAAGPGGHHLSRGGTRRAAAG